MSPACLADLLRASRGGDAVGRNRGRFKKGSSPDQALRARGDDATSAGQSIKIAFAGPRAGGHLIEVGQRSYGSRT